jgi:hypothetical protein
LKKKFLHLIFLCSTIAYAQNQSVSGILLDKTDNSTLIGADAILLHPSDSSVYKGNVADANGKFLITAVASGKYILKVSYLGYSEYFKNIEVLDMPYNAGTIFLAQKTNVLKTVEIVAKLPTATQRNDTTEFNAKAFKTNPDATAEDLVNKVPTISSQNGTVQAQGENVQQILVDGKPYFGGDPNTVLKNFPAEVIDKIQVFDQLSNQSQFTGFNDGNTTKTINIITKPNMRNGTFGKVYGGYGTNDKYRAGGNLSFFKGDRRISIITQSNNINEQNFSSEDLLGVLGGSSGGGGGQGGGGFGGSGQGGGGGPGNNSNNFLTTQQNGITKTNAVGLNYSDKWGKKIDVTGSYFLNQTNNVVAQTLVRDYVLQSQLGQKYNQTNTTTNNNLNHRFNAKLTWNIDSSNSIILTPKFSVQQNKSGSLLNGQTFLDSEPLNKTSSNTTSNMQAINFTNDLLLRHKFHKKGRTISADINTVYSPSNGTGSLNSSNNYYSDTTSKILNQISNNNNQGKTISTTINYTEPVINEKSIVQLSYANTYNFNDNNKKTYDYSDTSNSFSNLNTPLSNQYKSIYNTQSGGVGYRYNFKAVQWMVNTNYQVATLTSTELYPASYNLNRTFQSVLPSAMFRYNLNKKKNLRINYRTSTNQPGINQLQNVVNNSNPIQLSVGNTDLKQSYQHSVFIRYSATNSDKATSFFALLSGSAIQNNVVNSVYIAKENTVIDGVTLIKGSQLTQPVNMGGYYKVNSYITYGIPIKYIKTNLNFNLNAGYTRTPGLINNQTNYANSPVAGAGIVLSSNISKTIDYTLSSTSSYTTVQNTFNKASNNQYFSQQTRFKFNWIIWKSLVINTDLTHQYYKGLAASLNQNYIVWNAGLGYKFLKDKNAEFRLTVFDLLKQNTSVSRNITAAYIEDSQTVLLQRYFMVNFTYTIRQYVQVDEGKSRHGD